MDCFLTLGLNTHSGEVDFRARFVHENLELYQNSEINEPPLQYFEICGPCNGIYYLSDYYEMSRRLLNPTIKEVKVLPMLVMKPGLPDNLKYNCYEAYGLGYDPIAQDYKVVLLKEYRTENKFPYLDWHDKCRHPPSVLVYSLKTDSWKYWGDLLQYYDRLKNNQTHIFVNHCLHWVGSRLKDHFEAIISFNIVSNVLQEIQMPNYEKKCSKSLGIFKDSLAFYTTHNIRYEGERCFDVWTFREMCWTKQFTIRPIESHVTPIGHLNGMTLLNYEFDLVLCDPETEDMRVIAPKAGGFKSVVVYMESLVSINNFNKN